MNDDLVKRLREDQPVTQDMVSTMQCDLQNECADRIEELEAQLAEARLSELAALGQAQDAYTAQKEAEAELTEIKQDRPYVMGWNAGFEHAQADAEADKLEAMQRVREAAASRCDFEAKLAEEYDWPDGADQAAILASVIRAIDLDALAKGDE